MNYWSDLNQRVNTVKPARRRELRGAVRAGLKPWPRALNEALWIACCMREARGESPREDRRPTSKGVAAVNAKVGTTQDPELITLLRKLTALLEGGVAIHD